MRKELEKTYDPKQVEDRIYDSWMQGDYFHAKPNPGKKPFTIVIPRPTLPGSCTWATRWTTPCRIF